MNLETLPNEIFFDIFDYFSGTELLCAFYGLNMRLDLLLHQQFLHCSFEFHFLAKKKFDTICQEHIPRMRRSIRRINLSDHEETPRQCELFLTYLPSFEQFSHLQSLSLSHIRSYDLLEKWIHACHHLSQLKQLYLMTCYIQDTQADFQLLIDRIWKLPRLTLCHIGIGVKGQSLFRTPTLISSSIVSVSIEKMQLKLDQIHQLYQYTPNLAHLAISVPTFGENNYVPQSLPTLTSLEIRALCTCEATNIGTFLQSTPNLIQLAVELSSEIVDGNRWEGIISNHLAKLKTLRLKMKTTLPLLINMQQRTNGVIGTFKTPFWLDEHKWFVRCLTVERKLYLYSLSENYEESLPVTFNTTTLEDDEKTFYQSITRIETPSFFDQKMAATWICPEMIQHLHLNLPINNQFWSTITKLDRLETLKILLHANPFQIQVQTLLDRAPHLKKLSIAQSESMPLQTALFKYIHTSVHELDLRSINHYFNEDDCLKFSRSPLGNQCEKIFILVRNRESILCLVKNMPRLRSLKVRCQQRKNDSLPWLIDHLGTSMVITEDPEANCNILIWL